MEPAWDTRRVPLACDALAPDGSQIRLLPSVGRGSMVHCTLATGAVTRAVRHRSVDELWLCLGGRGQVWRRRDDVEQIVDVVRDVALSIPVGTAFQFRATGNEPLRLVIVTMPPWPGDEEAIFVEGAWEAKLRP
jgi:mannose-6-phosphate isomerase-like protein (cupin superfamily)